MAKPLSSPMWSPSTLSSLEQKAWKVLTVSPCSRMLQSSRGDEASSGLLPNRRVCISRAALLVKVTAAMR